MVTAAAPFSRDYPRTQTGALDVSDIAHLGPEELRKVLVEMQVESLSFQLAIAKASMLVDTVAMHAHRAADDIWQAAVENRVPTYLERARVRMDTGYCAETTRQAIDILLSRMERRRLRR